MAQLSSALGTTAAGLALVASLFATMPAVAGPNGSRGGGAAVPEASGLAQSTARLTALVAPGGNLVRSKNVAAVTNPSTGIVCIRPTPGKGINIARIVPSVTVEWGWSSGNNLVAYYFSNEPGFFTDCPSGYIEVRTYNFAGQLSNSVAFTIVVD